MKSNPADIQSFQSISTLLSLQFQIHLQTQKFIPYWATITKLKMQIKAVNQTSLIHRLKIKLSILWIKNPIVQILLRLYLILWVRAKSSYQFFITQQTSLKITLFTWMAQNLLKKWKLKHFFTRIKNPAMTESQFIPRHNIKMPLPQTIIPNSLKTKTLKSQ